MSNSVRPHRRQPTRIPRPWDSPGKNTGVGYHFLLQCMKVKSESEVAQSCPTLSTPWTAAYQAPPSMGFSRQKYWSGVPLPPPYLILASPYISSVCAKLLQLCLTLSDPMDCSLAGSSVHGILQARTLEWVALLSSRGSSRPGMEPASLASPAPAVGLFTTSATWEAVYGELVGPGTSESRQFLLHQGPFNSAPSLLCSWVLSSLPDG